MTPLPKKATRCPECKGKGQVNVTTAALLKKERKRRGLTQTAVAREAGWAANQVSEMESGARPLTEASAERYWAALLAAERKRGQG